MRRHAKAIVAISSLLLLSLALGIAPAMAAPPTVSIDPSPTATYATAEVSGEVDPADHGTYLTFQYSTDGVSWSPFTYEIYAEENTGPQKVSTTLTGLKAGTTYSVRLAAINFEDANEGSEIFSAEPNPTFTTDPVDPPTVTIDAPSAVTDSSAHFSGQINPNAPEAEPASPAVEAGYQVNWHFECTPECPGLSGGTVPADNTGHEVTADATGLEPNIAYEVTLVTENSGGPVTAGPESFKTEAVPIEIYPTVVFDPSQTGATVNAVINPHNAVISDCHFAYGKTEALGQSVPCATTPTGNSSTRVSARLSGLSPSTTYYFSLVVTDANGTSAGGDRSFSTLPDPAPEGSCANAAIRATQRATRLPDCRAYEMVSPAEKGGVDLSILRTVQTAPSGDAVAFSAAGALAGAQSNQLASYYIARRSATSWATEAIDPPVFNPDGTAGFATKFLSEDLSGAMQITRAALSPGAIEGGGNLYRRDNRTGARNLVLAAPAGPWVSGLTTFANSGRSRAMAASSDLSHFAFNAPGGLLLDAAPSARNVYELVGDEVRLVNYMPDGSVDPGGATITWGNPISPDGSRIFFNSPAYPGEAFQEDSISGLYMREDGTTTVPISVSQRPGDSSEAQVARFEGVSDDGSVVYFSSTAALTSDATPGGGAPYVSLYRYDIESGVLTDLTVVKGLEAAAPRFKALLGVSADGSSAYFSAQSALTPDAAVGATQIYYADEGGIHLVANGIPDTPAVSDNNRYLAFGSYNRSTGFDNGNPACEDRGLGGLNVELCSEAFAYDAVEDTLACMTCVSSGSGNRHSDLPRQLRSISEYAPRAVLDDGSVFFNSSEALAPEDVNGKQDVYRWKDGVNTLISSGRDPRDSTFADMSPDGRDVFFFTASRLVGADQDTNVDLYDARIGGGLAGQSPVSTQAPCQGDACQGTPATPPSAAAPASAAVSGPAKARRGGKAHKSCRKKSGKARKKCQAQARKRSHQASKSRGSK